MAGDPSQMQPRRSKSAAGAEWYVVAGGDARAYPVDQGLVVGESDSGVLAINAPDPRHQWVEFVLDDNGHPWATIVTRDKSLRVADTTCLRHRLQAGTMLQLPNNTLHISQDRATPQPSDTVVEVVNRDIPHLLEQLVGPEWEEALAAFREPHPDTPEVGIAGPFQPPDPALLPGERPREPRRRDWDHRSPAPLLTPERHHRRWPQAATDQRQVTVMAGMLGLGAGALVGAVVVLLVSAGPGESARPGDFIPDPVVTPPVGPPVQTPVPAQFAVPPPTDEPLVATAQVADVEPGAPTPEPAQPQPSSSQPAPATDPQPIQVATLPRPEPELSASAVEPVLEPQPQSSDRQARAAIVAQLEAVGLLAEAQTTELTRRRDLLAADLALAQGRLSTPPEASAYALYRRVLAVDPESPEAKSGMESVRQGLINRAMAQLAGGNLDDTRQTLRAAAEAGADPLLIADLHKEVDYRQQQIDGLAE